MAETIQGDSGNNSLTGTANADLILGFQGQDTITGNGGSDTIYGGQGADSISYGASGDVGSPLVYGGEGADTIISAGTGGNATILGDTGNPSIDSASGGADDIDVSADSGSDLVLGNYGDDTILGEANTPPTSFGSTPILSIYAGGQGNDHITVQSVANQIALGNEGNDIIIDGSIQTTVFGGMGNDTIGIDAVPEVINTAENGIVPNANWIGGEGSDLIVVGVGNNTVLGGTGDASIDSLSGAQGDGNDSIQVSFAEERQTDAFNNFTPSGADLILGNYGDDTINAGFQVSTKADTLVGGQGNDVIFAGATANNFIFGNQGDDAISDTLSGAGRDTIAGGQGNDTIVVGSAQVRNGDGFTEVFPGSDDLVYGNEGNNSISVVGVGNDTIYAGNSANDAVGNGDGNNIINVSQVPTSGDGVFFGGRGSASIDDLIFGGSGNDSINTGGTSSTLFDTVTGGAGADVFRYADAAAAASVAGTNSAAGTASGNDVITDMTSGVDKIAATGNPISNFSNIGSVTGNSLNAAAAAAEAILTQQYGAGTNAATFTYQGSTDTFAVVATTAATGGSATDLLVDIKATTALAKGDFTA